MLVMAREKGRGAPRGLAPGEIRALRESLGLTIEQAADKVGVRPRTWHAWELASQERRPSRSHLLLIHLLKAGKI